MDSYYINKNAQENGDHEVHKWGCVYMPTEYNRQFLGMYENCQDAINKVGKLYTQVDGCVYCCQPCHKS